MTSSLELVLHILHQCQQNNVTLGASLSSERSLPDLNDTLWCAIFVIHAFEFDFIF